MSEWIWLILLFLAVTALIFGVLQLLALRQQRVSQRLAKLGTVGPDSQPELVFGTLTESLSTHEAMSGEAQTALLKELRAAGFYRPMALMEYTAIRAVLVLVPLLGAGLLALLVERTRMMPILIGGVILAALGFSLPRIYLGYLARARAREIEKGLPVAVDLLTLAVSGGQNLIAALQRVSRELRLSYPILAEELQLVVLQANLNTLPHALEQMADRVQIQEVRNLAMILSQSQRLGTDIVSALLEFSTSYRTGLRQRAEAQANRAAFWMLFPSILCLWIPAAIILIGPIFYEFRHQRQQATELMRGSKDTLQNATGAGGMPPGGAPAPPGNGTPPE